jgi:hypothetical protein
MRKVREYRKNNIKFNLVWHKYLIII